MDYRGNLHKYVDIGDVCGSAEVTVKQTYKLLAPHAEELMRRTNGGDQPSTSARS